MTSFPRSRYWLYGVVALAGLGWDLWSKSRVFQELGYEYHTSDWAWETPLLWGRFAITLRTSFNRGALFGLGQGYAWLFALLSVIAVAGIVYWLFQRGEARSRTNTILLALITAGALGNLYDRIGLHGCRDAQGQTIYAVRDFIDCTIPGIRYTPPLSLEWIPEYDWPIFNFADAFLVTGTLSLLAGSFFHHPATAVPATPAPSPTTDN